MTMNPCMNPMTYGTKMNCQTKSLQDFREIQCLHQCHLDEIFEEVLADESSMSNSHFLNENGG